MTDFCVYSLVFFELWLLITKAFEVAIASPKGPKQYLLNPVITVFKIEDTDVQCDFSMILSFYCKVLSKWRAKDRRII